jgi:hypothetical protein
MEKFEMYEVNNPLTVMNAIRMAIENKWKLDTGSPEYAMLVEQIKILEDEL